MSADQLGLLDWKPPAATDVTDEEQRARDLEASFQAFHEANPHVYAKLVQLAREARAVGHQRIGIGMLWEVLRWQLQIITSRQDGDFRLNNNHRSRYARLIMASEPDLADVFETRELRS